MSSEDLVWFQFYFLLQKILVCLSFLSSHLLLFGLNTTNIHVLPFHQVFSVFFFIKAMQSVFRMVLFPFDSLYFLPFSIFTVPLLLLCQILPVSNAGFWLLGPIYSKPRAWSPFWSLLLSSASLFSAVRWCFFAAWALLHIEDIWQTNGASLEGL